MEEHGLEWEIPISTGFEKLDTMLLGGLARGEVLELYGESGTGKSQICMAMAANFASDIKNGTTVLYIDANNDIIPSRLLNITQENLHFMRQIRVVRESNAASIISVLEHFYEEIAIGQSRFAEGLRLVVIDSVPAIIYPEMKNGNSSAASGRILQEQFSQMIKKFSISHGVSFVLVNNAVSFKERTRVSNPLPQQTLHKPALGKFWVHMPHFRIFLQRDNSFMPVLRATLEKSARSPVNISFDFNITESGVE